MNESKDQIIKYMKGYVRRQMMGGGGFVQIDTTNGLY